MMRTPFFVSRYDLAGADTKSGFRGEKAEIDRAVCKQLKLHRFPFSLSPAEGNASEQLGTLKDRQRQLSKIIGAFTLQNHFQQMPSPLLQGDRKDNAFPFFASKSAKVKNRRCDAVRFGMANLILTVPKGGGNGDLFPPLHRRRTHQKPADIFGGAKR